VIYLSCAQQAHKLNETGLILLAEFNTRVLHSALNSKLIKPCFNSQIAKVV